MNFKRYIYTFVITLVIFAFCLWLSNTFSNQKVQSLRDLESQISLNILSSETRFSLLQKTSCEHVINQKDSNIGFNAELNDVAQRVKFLENQLGYDNVDVSSLKRYYSLLQIKDYLLAKEFHDRCKQNTVSILYFHSAPCEECARQSIVLDKIASDYPEIRVYYFDITTNTPALDTLASIFKIKTTPSIVVNDVAHYGFQDLAKIESYIPEIKVWKKAKTATSTVATSSASTTKKK